MFASVEEEREVAFAKLMPVTMSSSMIEEKSGFKTMSCQGLTKWITLFMGRSDNVVVRLLEWNGVKSVWHIMGSMRCNPALHNFLIKC